MGGPNSLKTGLNSVGDLPVDSPKVAFLYATFPRPTETFVRRELTALWEIGAKVTPISIWRGDDMFEGRKIDRFRLRELWSLLFWLPYWILIRPQEFREVLSDLWELSCPSVQNWNETFLGLGFALVRAHQMKHQGYALCHAVWATMPATAAFALKKLVGIEYSMGAHAYDVFRGNGDWLLKQKLREAAFVRTSSVSTEERLFEVGLPSEKLKLIRRGLSKWPSVIEQESFASPIQILSVGRLVPKKGYFEQLSILRALRAAGIEFEARIVGGGPLRDKLERERDRLGLTEDVTFLGALPEDKAHVLFSESDIFLFTGKVAPDGDRDGLPNVIPEAMSAGVVVIASPHGGAGEALEEGITGFVRDPHRTDQWVELIQGLLASSKKVASLRKSAVASARIRFDVRRTARELFANLVGVCKE